MSKERIEQAMKREALDELSELDIEIAHLEALIDIRNEQRRELINYLGLNKPQPKK